MALTMCLAHDDAAVPGVNFAWNACLSEGGVSTRTSPCASDDGEQVAVGSFVLAHDQDIQVGIQVTIDLQVDAAALVVDSCLKFQAGSVPCSYLPARAITWGQIKSLYR